MPNIGLSGNMSVAAKWIGFAMRKLVSLKQSMVLGRLKQSSQSISLRDANINIQSGYGLDIITIEGLGGGVIIICYIGTSTADYQKKYFTIDGIEIPSPTGWVLKDDGKYGLIWDGIPKDDPYLFSYYLDGGGLGVPAAISRGIPAKSQAGTTARFILSQAVEDERFIAVHQRFVLAGAFDYTYNFLYQVDSLSFAPYKQYGNKPWMIRRFESKDSTGTIVESGYLFIPIKWAGSETTLFYEAVSSAGFLDTIPVGRRIYKHLDTGEVSYQEVSAWGDLAQALISTPQYSQTKSSNQKIVRANTFTWGTSIMAEPMRQEIYDMAAMTGPTTGTEYHRCSDPGSNTCYMLDASTISGRTFDGSGFITNTGQSTISNDLIVLFTITEDGKKTYVRMQKDTEFTSHNSGVYCADVLIEESGFLPVTRLCDEDPVGTPGRKVAEYNGPLLIRQQDYKILHAHHSPGFDMVLYEKTAYQGYDTELVGYKIMRGSPINDYCQVRKTCMRSMTTYHVAVNGVITDLSYQCQNREYRLTVSSEAYAGADIPVVFAHIAPYPWLDIGYDAAGDELMSEDNSNLTRIFTDASGETLLLGFDVFPVKFRHELVYDVYDNLTLDYKTVIAPFPPSSDGVYANVKDRKWLLFGSSGVLKKSITPPQITVGDTKVNVGRVNGLCLLSA